MRYFDKRSYLRRLGIETAIVADIPSLTVLQRQHVFTIPFENLDIMLGRGISVDLPDIYNKVINRGRGGYCFELNALFCNALENFGFDVQVVLGRVHLGMEPSGRTHQITLVRVGSEQYIVDVGFGALSLRTPVPLAGSEFSQQDHLQYRIIEDPTWRYMMQVRNSELGGTDWFNMYSFDLEHVCEGDIATGNHYTSTSPDVHFTKDRIASLLTPDGRIALSGNQLTSVSGGDKFETSQSTIATSDYIRALKSKFNLVLDATFEDFTDRT